MADVNNQKIRRIAEPRLQTRKVKGRLYYVYQRGTDQPVYLGTAEFILKCVSEYRGKLARVNRTLGL